MPQRWGDISKGTPLDPLVPQCMAANTSAYTNGTILYVRYPVKADALVTGCNVFVQSFTGSGTLKVGFYNYLPSGTITKYGYGSGTVTITATGEFTINFDNAMSMVKNTTVTLALLPVSGTYGLASRTSAPSNTALGWTGATLQTDFPATDATARSAAITWPYIEWLTV